MTFNVFAKDHRGKRTLAILIVLAACFFLSAMPVEAQMGPDYWVVQGVASDDTLNIRSGPGTINRVVARAPNGAVFRNLGCRGEGSERWCHVETPDGRIDGWASGRYLQESGAPNTASHSGNNDVPELHLRNTGEMEVRFAAGCTALYNPSGRRITAGSSCSGAQLSAAHDAIESYMRENGGNGNASDASSGETVALKGTGTIIGGARLSGSIIGKGIGNYALLMTGEGLVCTAGLQHAPGTVASELASLHCSNGAHGVVTVKEHSSGYIANFSLTQGDSGWVIFERS